MEPLLPYPPVLLAVLLCIPLRGAAQGDALGSASRSDSIDLLHTRIELDMTATGQGQIHGRAHLRFTPRVEGIGTIQFDLVPAADSVTMDGVALAFTQASEVLTIELPGSHGTADTLEVTVHYGGHPPTDPSGFGGFYLQGNYQYNLGVAFQHVPHSYGRAWFPCFDNFVERCTFDLEVRTDTGRTVFANGALQGVTGQGDERITHWRIDEPIPAYLVSVAAGNYFAITDTFPSVAGTDIPVVIAALPSDTGHVRASFAHLKDAFDAFEDWFGPYRWNRVGYVLTSVGAMEHATNICFPDFTINGTLQYEDLIAHELSHHWFGNLITCERPEEMYINEGFADFCAMLFMGGTYGDSVYRQLIRSNHRRVITRAHVVDEGWYALNDIPAHITYGETTYKKGADVARTLRSVMGDSLFRVGMKRVFNNNAYRAIGSEALRDSLEVATGMDLSDFFNDWIFQPGGSAFWVDSFTVQPSGAAFRAEVFASQRTRGGAEPFHQVPVSLSFLDAAGAMHREVVELGGIHSSAIVQLDFEPVRVRLNDDDRLALATTWDTATVFNTSKTLSQADVRLAGNGLAVPVHFRVEEYWVAADASPDAAYLVSPDRWWRIETDAPEGASVMMRITLDGRPGMVTAYDQGLMEDFSGVSFHEDSLVVLYRPDPRSPWTVKESSVSTLGSPTDRNARMDIPNTVSGDYAMAWRVLPVGLAESSDDGGAWRYFPDPATNELTILPPDRSLDKGSMLVVSDMAGRMLERYPLHPGVNRLNVSRLPRQTVLLTVHLPEGRIIPLGRIHLTH